MSAEFVAEFTTNHMGNLNLLLRMVDEAAGAGASVIKMQKKDVERFYSKEKLDTRYESPYGKTYRDYRTIFEFDEATFRVFDARCRERGIDWFATAHDLESLAFLERFQRRSVKIASVNARNEDFLRRVAERVPGHIRVVISVGGSKLREVETTLGFFPRHEIRMLHCVAEYPCPLERLRLGNIPVLQKEFGDERIRIGYSGHEIGIEPSLAAIALGAVMVERHFCMSRRSFVHHIECSLEPEEFRRLVSLGRRGANLDRYVDSLPRAALASDFGMSDVERKFLLCNEYGTDFLVAGR